MARYKVVVNDNFHYMDASEQYELASYETYEAALAVCNKRVDEDLSGFLKPGMSADELFDMYAHFGEDPYIVDTEAPIGDRAFSARTYARARAKQICS